MALNAQTSSYETDMQIQAVENRNARTLLALIQCYILPGATIIFDCWRAYNRIEQFSKGYCHLTVNHSINFVDSETDAHTNIIEQLWQKFKRRHTHKFGNAISVFESYTSDFCWCQRFKGPGIFYLWSQIALYYPVEQSFVLNKLISV